MNIDKFLIDSFVKTTERAAYGASVFKGKNDKIAADQAAVDEMRNELNKINMKGKIVIGEGELDEAPMLYINEEVGTKNGDASIAIITHKSLEKNLRSLLISLAKNKFVLRKPTFIRIEQV